MLRAIPLVVRGAVAAIDPTAERERVWWGGTGNTERITVTLEPHVVLGAEPPALDAPATVGNLTEWIWHTRNLVPVSKERKQVHPFGDMEG